MRKRMLHCLINIPLLGNLIFRISQKSPCDSVEKFVKGSRNRIETTGAILSDVKIEIVGDGNSVLVGSGTVIRGVSIILKGNNHVVRIGSDCRFAAGTQIVVEDANCLLEIGDRCTFEQAHLAVTESGSQLRMGKDCMVASEVEMRTGDSHAIFQQDSGKRINPAKSIVIGEHVWIASRATLLKGACLGRNSVLGAGSVLTKPFDREGVVIVGNPARVVQEGVYWTRER